MALEFQAALEGNLEEFLKAEIAAGERAAMAAMTRVSERAKLRLRDQVTGAGMGTRLSNTWRSNVYPTRGASLNAAALIHTRAPTIVRAFNEGVTITSKSGGFLAIPTDAVPKNLSYNDPVSGDRMRNKRATVRGVEQALGLKLRFVYRPGKTSLLVADDARLTKKGQARLASKTARAKGRVATVVMFILVPQVRLPKRFNVERVEEQAGAELEAEVINQWKAEAG